MEGRFLGNQVPIQAQIAAARHVDAAFAMKPHLCTMDHITSIMLSIEHIAYARHNWILERPEIECAEVKLSANSRFRPLEGQIRRQYILR
ncbi:hypothetical protein D7S68_17325 [Ralstonia pickettii]|nr:hypothetical protein [Ralstonia pickettii]MBA9893157.1 hypothetical protein [Ralstonia pickettii]MBA9925413.1 hypothetical protein [Ralstonia pickettii]MBB0178338.1 hypothetical protein [Ralstonia pickettii]MBB0201285.1 hypothetical protein [Ralstonia pickettii]